VAELGRLWHSQDPQAGTVRQIRTEEAHPNSIHAVTVGPPEPPSILDVVICWSIIGFEPTATDVTTTNYLAGVEC
jgi:hypothetical protein